MPVFAELQAAFAAAVVDPDVPVPEAVFADTRHQRRERFGVYRNNVISGLIEQLTASFPVVRRLVGDAFFRAMARAYVLAHPPRSPVLMNYGDAFAAFIKRFPPASGLPYLADIATLEAMRIDAYHAADAICLPSEAAMRLAKARPRALGLHPSAKLLRSRFPVLAIWLANQPGAAPCRIRIVDGENVLVVRPEMTVTVHRIEAQCADLFEALRHRTLPRSGASDDALAALGVLADRGALVEAKPEEKR